MVVVTSIKLARRRLRYESWHLLHLYAYLGVGLALPHQLWTGQQFLGSPGRTVFWWTAWAVAAGAILVWRVGLPAYRTLRHDLRVTSVVREADGVVSVYVTGRDLHALEVEAGQFFTWRFLAGPGWSRAHPYSLSAAPDGRSLRITVKDLGDGSRDVARLRPGTRVLVEGPYGRLSARARTRRHVALIGAGVGITPLRSLAEGLPYAPGEAVLVHRYGDRPLFGRELDVLAAERGLQVIGLPGPRRPPVPTSPAPCSTTSPTSPTATSTSAARGVGRRDRPGGPRRRPPARAPPHRDLRVVTCDEAHRPVAAQHRLRGGAAVRLPHLHLRTRGHGPDAGRREPGHDQHHDHVRRFRLRTVRLGQLRWLAARRTQQSSGTTVTGDVAQTRWGPVQVQLTTDGSGTITKVEVVQYPSGNGMDEQINSYALPRLVQATLDAQSANIDMVSGATVTSDGYLRSLQSALDQVAA